MPRRRRSSRSSLISPIRSGHVVVVRARHGQELDPALAQLGHGRDDVTRGDRDVLRAGAAVELQVLVDLRLALALGGLVDRELDAAVAARDHLGHQRGVLGRDRLVAEVQHLRHPEDVLVVLDPRLHLAQLDVADDVVDREQADAGGAGVARRVAGHERALVFASGRRTCAASRRRSRSWRSGSCRARRSPPTARARPWRRASSPRGRRASTSGTDSAITFTPSPWAAWWRPISWSGTSAPVRTIRMRPCSSTCDVRSRTPVSRPA